MAEKRTTWSVPFPSVAYSVTADGAATLARLVSEHAMFEPSAIVELGPYGFTAALIYRRPGFPDRIQHAHVSLAWAPMASAEAAA